MTRLSKDNGDVFVSVRTILSDHADPDRQPVSALEVLEDKPMSTGKVKVELNAEAMAVDIDKKGSVRIYGIYFDTEKASIKEDAESVLAEIASLLEQNPKLNLGVVSHTDATESMKGQYFYLSSDSQFQKSFIFEIVKNFTKWKSVKKIQKRKSLMLTSSY